MTNPTDLIARLRAEDKRLRKFSFLKDGDSLEIPTLAGKAATALEALARENAALREAQAWRPIETAPKDGGEVITCREINPHLPLQIGTDSYMVVEPGGEGWLPFTILWQPFPAPPSKETGDGG